MISSIPAIVATLALTGSLAALWRIWGWVRDRRERSGSPATPGGDAGEQALTARLGILLDLTWTGLFLVHFVFLIALAESKEIGWRLSSVATLAAVLCVCCALGSLVSGFRLERRLRGRGRERSAP